MLIAQSRQYKDDKDTEKYAGGMKEEPIRKRSRIVDVDNIGVGYGVEFLYDKRDMCCMDCLPMLNKVGFVYFVQELT